MDKKYAEKIRQADAQSQPSFRPVSPKPGCSHWKDQQVPSSIPDVDSEDNFEPSPKRPK